MKCIYRTYLSDSGQILYHSAAGRRIDLATATEHEILQIRKSEMTYCSQFLQVIPRVAALDVVASALMARGHATDDARQITSECFERLSLPRELWDAYPSTFSGGEQQRVNIARAIISRPRILLVDEPTASLDTKTKDAVIGMILELKNAGPPSSSSPMMSIHSSTWQIVPCFSKTAGSKRRSVRRAAFLASLLLLASMTACKSSQQNGDPPVLRYVMIPSQEEMQDDTVRASLMSKYLTAELHIPVEIMKVSGYAPTIEAMRARKVDIATFGPLGYIIASQKAGAVAIVASGTPDRKLDTYNSIIAVPKNSPLHSIADLKARAKNLTFVFVDPASTSGYLIPRAYLQSIGIHPDQDFGKVVFSGSHLASVMTIKAGKADAGSVMQQVLIPRLIALGKLAPDDLRVLWTSAGIPDSPICVRKSLSAPLQEKIRQALLAIPQKDPVLWKTIKEFYHRPNMTFVPVQDSSYDGLRAFAAQLKDVNFGDK